MTTATATNRKTGHFLVRSLSVEERNQFKAKCASDGVGMDEAFRRLVLGYIAGNITLKVEV